MYAQIVDDYEFGQHKSHQGQSSKNENQPKFSASKFKIDKNFWVGLLCRLISGSYKAFMIKALLDVYRDHSLDLVFAPWPCRNIWMK